MARVGPQRHRKNNLSSPYIRMHELYCEELKPEDCPSS